MSDLRPSDVADSWLQRARSDLALGQAALRLSDVMPEDAAFHAQQSAEKALKALLSDRGVAFPQTHAVAVPLDLLRVDGVVVPPPIDEAIAMRRADSVPRRVRGSNNGRSPRCPGAWL